MRAAGLTSGPWPGSRPMPITITGSWGCASDRKPTTTSGRSRIRTTMACWIRARPGAWSRDSPLRCKDLSGSRRPSAACPDGKARAVPPARAASALSRPPVSTPWITQTRRSRSRAPPRCLATTWSSMMRIQTTTAWPISGRNTTRVASP